MLEKLSLKWTMLYEEKFDISSAIIWEEGGPSEYKMILDVDPVFISFLSTKNIEPKLKLN